MLHLKQILGMEVSIFNDGVEDITDTMVLMEHTDILDSVLVVGFVGPKKDPYKRISITMSECDMLQLQKTK